MKIKPYVDKLCASKEYKDFMEKHKDAFVVAGFFIIDFEMGKNIHQIDYYIPSEKKVAAFTLDDEIKVQTLDLMDEKVPEELSIETNIDLDELHGILQDEMRNRHMTEEIQKMIAVIQNVKGKKLWNINCILSGMGILKVHVEDDSKTVLKMDKASITDILKKLPADQIAKQAPKSKEDIEEHIKKLDKLEEAIEKEKEALRKESGKEKKKSKEGEDSKDEEVKMAGCKKCGGQTTGFKCELCGAEADEHHESHSCGGEHCIPKCVGCGEAESKCTCK